MVPHETHITLTLSITHNMPLYSPNRVLDYLRSCELESHQCAIFCGRALGFKEVLKPNASTRFVFTQKFSYLLKSQLAPRQRPFALFNYVQIKIDIIEPVLRPAGFKVNWTNETGGLL